MYGIGLLLYYHGHNNYGTSMLTWRRSLAMQAHVDLYLNDGRSGSLIHKENVVNLVYHVNCKVSLCKYAIIILVLSQVLTLMKIISKLEFR